MAQFVDDPTRILVPRALFELKAEPGEFLLEDAGALDVIGDDRAARAVDEEHDAAHLRPEVDAEISAGGEPRQRIGPAENRGVEAVGVEKRDHSTMLFLHVLVAAFLQRVGVVDGGIHQRGEGVGVRSIRSRPQNAVETWVRRQIRQGKRGQFSGMRIGCHRIASLRSKNRRRRDANRLGEIHPSGGSSARRRSLCEQAISSAKKRVGTRYRFTKTPRNASRGRINFAIGPLSP